MAKWDFVGWATRNDIRCSDGRTIRQDAFADCDGKTVPLVWNHGHRDATNILGHGLLENRSEGVRVYGKFNETEPGLHAKAAVDNGDITGLSIWANQLKEKGGDVLHGVIREVSLVLAGANPGAYIDTLSVEHGDGGEGEAYIFFVEEGALKHADEDEDEKDKDKAEAEDKGDEDEKDKDKAEEKGDESETDADEKPSSVLSTLTDEQKLEVYSLVDALLDELEQKDEVEEEKDMKHNVFEEKDDAVQTRKHLSHDDFMVIMADAKRAGSLKEAVLMHMEEGGVLAHSLPSPIPTDGMDLPTGTQTYGFNDPNFLFPEARAMSATPEWIKRNDEWVSKVMGAVHRTPFSRIKSVFADITEDEARAKGYMKGNRKTEEVFSLLKRTTTPQTIYKKQKMDRDDIIDITGFDVVAWIRAEMRLMLNEEIARAILIGDGRLNTSDDKISPDHIRPVATDADLFNVKVHLASADPKVFINSAIRARKNYKGTGSPTLFTTEDMLTEMLLLEDQIGHKLYKTEAELATALRVREIVTVEVMENQTINGETLAGIIVNLADYNVGADKGGEINMFDDFDIDYNQYKYLLETRISGALVKPFSALTFTVVSNTTDDNEDNEGGEG